MPNNRVAYVISPQIPAAQNLLIKKALAYWKANIKATVPILFEAKTAADVDFIEFVPVGGSRCASFMGRVGGRQTVDLAPNCNEHSIRHELGHVLGLNHEHQRFDRDNFVTVNFANITPEFQSDYVVLSAAANQPVGPYDFNSLMHYTSDVGCIELPSGSCQGFPMLKKSDQSVVGSLGVLTAEDKLGVKALYADPAPQVFTGNLGGSWAVARTFKSGPNHFLLTAKLDGTVEISSLNGDGTPGLGLHSYLWSSGWDIFRFFTLGDVTYLFTLKSGVGTMNVNKMNLDGSVGALVQAATWTTGWNTAEFFKEGANTYLFNVKSGAGTMHISKVNANGSIGALVQQATWSSGWTHASVMQTSPTQAVIFTLKSATGNTDINEMNADGTMGLRIAREVWSAGWTQTRYFTAGGANFFYSYKSGTGTVHINEVNANGTLGRLRYLDRRATGINDMSFYPVVGVTHSFVTKLNGAWGVNKHGL